LGSIKDILSNDSIFKWIIRYYCSVSANVLLKETSL